jgi:coenzyme F420-reducing hydrogenase alpha subunit
MMDHPKIKKIYDKYEDSIYTRIVARVYEPIEILRYIQSKIEEIDLCEPSFIKNSIKNSKGIGVVEAPRGSLIHEIEIENEKIKSYNIIVPTQFNLSSSTKEKPSAAQAAMMGEEVKFIDSIFKCFDICAVCVSH